MNATLHTNTIAALTKAELKRLRKIENQEKTIRAAQEYKDLRDRKMNPNGAFDSGGRFYLAGKCACCAGIRPPSGKYPYSQMAHGRSALHVAHGFKVEESDVKYIARMLDAGYQKSDLLDIAARLDAHAASDAIEQLLEECAA